MGKQKRERNDIRGRKKVVGRVSRSNKFVSAGEKKNDREMVERENY